MKAKKKKVDTYEAEELGVDLEVSDRLFLVLMLLFLFQIVSNLAFCSQRTKSWKFSNLHQEKKESLLRMLVRWLTN